MSYPSLRSLNEELTGGMGDGKYRRVAPNRSGVVEQHSTAQRMELNTTWYGEVSEETHTLRPDTVRSHQRGRGRF